RLVDRDVSRWGHTRAGAQVGAQDRHGNTVVTGGGAGRVGAVAVHVTGAVVVVGDRVVVVGTVVAGTDDLRRARELAVLALVALEVARGLRRAGQRRKARVAGVDARVDDTDDDALAGVRVPAELLLPDTVGARHAEVVGGGDGVRV